MLRVEKLIGSKLTADQKRLAKLEINAVQGPLGNKDLIRIAKRLTEDSDHPSTAESMRSSQIERRERELTPESIQLPVVTPSSHAVSIRQSDSPSVYSISSRTLIQTPPSQTKQKGMSSWAQGVIVDVERYKSERAQQAQRNREAIIQHRAALEQQILERKTAAELERHHEKRYLSSLQTSKEIDESDHTNRTQQQKERWQASRNAQLHELEMRRTEKKDRERHEIEEDRAQAAAITSQLARERSKKEERTKDQRRQVQEYNELLREKERRYAIRVLILRVF